MAKYREPEYCLQCGKVLQPIHDNIPGFVGDTFKGYKPCDHVQNNPTPSIEERAKDGAEKEYPQYEPDGKTFIINKSIGIKQAAYMKGFKAGFIAGSSQGSDADE